MKWIKTMRLTSRLLIPVLLFIVATVNSVVANAPPLATIKSAQIKGEGVSTELLVSASVPVTYTSYKTVGPIRLVVDFSQVSPAEGLAEIQAGQGPVKAVTFKRFDTEAGVLTRMEIELSQDIDPVIAPVPDQAGVLKVSFPGFKPVAVEPATAASNPMTAADKPEEKQKQEPVAASDPKPVDQKTRTFEKTVVTGIAGRNGVIEILMDGAAEFKSSRLNKPDRIVVDIFDAKITQLPKMVLLNTSGVSTARTGVYPEKVRIVLDAQNGGLPDAVVEKSDLGIIVRFTKSGVAANSNKAEVPKAEPRDTSTTTSSTVSTVEAIDFQVVDTISRLSVKVSGGLTVDEPVKSSGFVSIKIKNANLPRKLQRSLEAREFASPVLRVTPIQLRSKKGLDTLIRVAMRSDAPYEIKRESDVFYVDFKNPPDLPKNVTSADMDQKAGQGAKAASNEPTVDQQLLQSSGTKKATGKPVYTGRKVTLEFADAEVRKIFQLLSEVSNKNFVLGDEVGGSISLKLVNVPWDQALDIILDTKGLDKREEGNIILVRGKGKFKSLLDEEVEIRKAALKSEPLDTVMFEVNYADLAGVVTQFNALKTDRGVITQDTRTNKVIVKDVKTALEDMRRILKSLDVPEKQVMIEARIIEATTSFTKSLGIHWGLHTNPDASGDKAPFVKSFDSSFGGLAATAAPLAGLYGVPGAFSDISFGTIGKNVNLSMRLNAAATAGMVKIISSPKVATLNNKTAKITQGQQIPYTSATADKIETKFVEAALSLEVTPHINNNGTIVMKIDAKNDAPDRQTAVGMPPINKKQATTEMLLKDGETTVIGGIFVDRDTEGQDGVPWLMDIPFLGSLFKSNNTEKTKNELLIFITPRILNTSI